MDSIIYKVIFKAQKRFENKNLTLSFVDLNFEQPLTISADSVLKLKKLSEINKEVLNFQNIEEVLIIGNPVVNYTYNYYLVVLFKLKENGKKFGFLIGNVKKLGDLIIGYWPFNTFINKENTNKVLESYYDLVEKPQNYSDICLISQ